jgi:nitrite reductase/ring-hydroxylating ferredoxin subunit
MKWRELVNAPESGAYIGSLQTLPDGGVQEVVFGEGKDAFPVILLREGVKVIAYLNRCPHYSIPLNTVPGKFFILPERQIMCATHCAVFRITDGQCVDGPVRGDQLTAIEIEIDDDGVISVADER